MHGRDCTRAKDLAMPTGDEKHGFGHSDTCYWCGFNPDTDQERPCDERLHEKPTEEQMRHFACTRAIEDALHELEGAELLCEKHGYRDVAKGVYDARLRLSDALRRLEGMASQRQRSEP